MTKKQLIDMLAKYPDDMPIVVRSREEGVDEVGAVVETEVYLNHWDARKHEPAEAWQKESKLYDKNRFATVLYLKKG